jgi:hypothetical protein
MGPAMSLALSDAQVNHIQLVSQPLQPQERAAFMARLFEDLLRREEVGDGELGRLLRDLQGRYFKPPAIDEREAPRWDSRSLGYSIPSPLRRKLAKRAAR